MSNREGGGGTGGGTLREEANIETTRNPFPRGFSGKVEIELRLQCVLK